ncbi:hypothetical protein CDD80_4654 [Ophiocordyceps camponoti-rufipedis]|uniref:RNase III domain-containing protein n=1 Tax=Ophiocordyceps camponoti-rufipedis TaxID=2004952 RepID=A0A2C5YYZ9_9HYPO|nr:hypothetical protein CDD80_4654 [Ophiocordyceps camponoti-rufipedis]
MWPEGYLTAARENLVANSRLCRASREKDLAKFILTKSFTGKKWRPLYLDQLKDGHRQQTGGVRIMSTKTLADVVEALIGASYMDGGLSKALICISSFLDDKEMQWRHVDDNRERLFEMVRSQSSLPPALEQLEALMGYSFRKKALLVEAMTHGSYVLDINTRSYERLEFLGDAVLDYIIVTKLFSVEPPLSHHRMHSLKSAMVNGDFLAFVVMENSSLKGEGGRDVLEPLSRFMRHGSSVIGTEQRAMKTRYEELRGEIREAMVKGKRYPWALLARMRAKKFVSDLFEAFLGAVWVDSGSTEACKAIVAQFGILAYLEFLLRNDVDARHPKQELGEWAGRQKMEYEVDVTEGRYVCRVLIGDVVVCTVEDGLSAEEAQTRAADKVMRRVWVEGGELDTG